MLLLSWMFEEKACVKWHLRESQQAENIALGWGRQWWSPMSVFVMSILNLITLLIFRGVTISLTTRHYYYFQLFFFFKSHFFISLKCFSQIFLLLGWWSNSNQMLYYQNRFNIWTKFQTRSSVLCFLRAKNSSATLHYIRAMHRFLGKKRRQGDSFQSQACERGRTRLQVEFPISNFPLTSRPVADIHRCCPAIRRVQHSARWYSRSSSKKKKKGWWWRGESTEHI